MPTTGSLSKLFWTPYSSVFVNTLNSMSMIEKYANILGVSLQTIQSTINQDYGKSLYKPASTDIGQYEIDGEIVYVIFHNSFGELEFTSREKFLETVCNCFPNRIRWVSDNEPLQDSTLSWDVEGQDEHDEYDYPIGVIIKKITGLVGVELTENMTFDSYVELK